jgi:UDP-N-acetylglucosamine--N-acetylmuramyl-(pentapeptide) pyrophosphoryl-undecaprenol N-acetylglucosamine transferase
MSHAPSKILLTGGHAATTALSVVEELAKRSVKVPLELYWVGAKRAIEGKAVSTLESQVFPKHGVKSYSIIAGRLQRKFNLWTIPSLAKIPLGFLGATTLLFKIRPNIILSFGGFAAFPVVLVGWILGIPVILHEQTVTLGRANKFSIPFARKVALARKESLSHVSSPKAVVTGNPIMSQIAAIKPKDKIGNPPTILITGGSRGSVTINGLVEPVLGNLIKKYRLIHQTGVLDFEKFAKLKSSLPQSLKERYEVYSQIEPMKMAEVYQKVDVLVGRSGANTVSEVVSLRIPAIFIPIPFSYEDEQTKNALFAQRVGIAKIISQNDVTSGKLLKEIASCVENWDTIVSKSGNNSAGDRKAASRLVDLVFKELGI